MLLYVQFHYKRLVQHLLVGVYSTIYTIQLLYSYSATFLFLYAMFFPLRYEMRKIILFWILPFLNATVVFQFDFFQRLFHIFDRLVDCTLL